MAQRIQIKEKPYVKDAFTEGVCVCYVAGLDYLYICNA